MSSIWVHFALFLIREIVLSLETSLQLMEESSGSGIVDVYGTNVDRIVDICKGKAIPNHLRGKVTKGKCINMNSSLLVNL